MTNLPSSTQSGDLDNISVSRAEFRTEIGILLEYVAQALGGVSGNYTTETVDPLTPILQGAPTLEVGAEPAASDESLRLPTTRWVKKNSTFVGATAPGSPTDGMLWVDISTDPYTLKAYNQAGADWDVFSGFPSGTKMLFQQAAAPTGWTKDTTHNNKALRVVTGTPGSGGSRTFSEVFQNSTVTGTVGNTSLTVDQLPGHSHGITDAGHIHGIAGGGDHVHELPTAYILQNDGGSQRPDTGQRFWGVASDLGWTYTYAQSWPADSTYSEYWRPNTSNFPTSSKPPAPPLKTTAAGSSASNTDSAITNVTVQSTGAGDPHTHTFSSGTLDLDIQYVDLIICTRS